MASVLRDATTAVKAKAKNWKEIVKKLESKYPADVAEALTVIGKSKDKTSEEYTNAVKLIDTKVNNLESNLHIEIDMERIEDKSKALSYIGIEIADALKYIPAPVDEVGGVAEIEPVEEENVVANAILEPAAPAENVAAASTETTEEVAPADISTDDIAAYFEETRFEAKPTLWQRIKNSKFVRTIRYIMQIRVVLDYPALPEGRDNY